LPDVSSTRFHASAHAKRFASAVQLSATGRRRSARSAHRIPHNDHALHTGNQTAAHGSSQSTWFLRDRCIEADAWRSKTPSTMPNRSSRLSTSLLMTWKTCTTLGRGACFSSVCPPPPPSPALAGAAAAEERCIIRYSTLRAVPVFLPPARSVARRSSASHPVFHGLGDTKLPQTGFAHRVLERRSSGLDCRPTALPRPLRSPWLTPIRKPSTHQLGQFRPLSRARPARHAPGHAHIGGERVILETTKHAHRPRCNGHLLWQLKKNGFARPGGMVGQTTEAETRVSN
jgi:hypothetical protein